MVITLCYSSFFSGTISGRGAAAYRHCQKFISRMIVARGRRHSYLNIAGQEWIEYRIIYIYINAAKSA